jgi:hypothetical protein
MDWLTDDLAASEPSAPLFEDDMLGEVGDLVSLAPDEEALNVHSRQSTTRTRRRPSISIMKRSPPNRMQNPTG